MVNTLRCDSTIINDAILGRVLSVTFAGFYPSGSRGRGTAQAMLDFAAAEKARHHPAALLLDCTDLDYFWGDGPVALLLRLSREDRRRGIHCPLIFVAQGSTAQALGNLLACSGVTRLIHTVVAGSVAEGIEFLCSSPQA